MRILRYGGEYVITVLRIGHRISRDKRITTHVALVARAFGADQILISTRDEQIEKTVCSVTTRFGGKFIIKSGVEPKKAVNKWKGMIVHLTMYGDNIEKILPEIEKHKDLLIIVGAEKVPPYYYEKADFNISVGNQPHSEVSALAIFLDRYTNGTWVSRKFNGKLEILPSHKRKTVQTHHRNE
jgi:tRNA (cytidine56-2'-O)-methyltransferase